MSIECPRCSATVSPRARYCPRCGTALSAPLDPADPAGPYLAWQKARRERAVGWVLFVLGLLLMLSVLAGFRRLSFMALAVGALGAAMLARGLGALVGKGGKIGDHRKPPDGPPRT